MIPEMATVSQNLTKVLSVLQVKCTIISNDHLLICKDIFTKISSYKTPGYLWILPTVLIKTQVMKANV